MGGVGGWIGGILGGWRAGRSERGECLPGCGMFMTFWNK